MLKETRTYEDYNGVERTEDFYFNFSKAELTEMEMSLDGGLQGYLEKIVKAKDNKELVKYFKMIVLKAYGEKSEDGKRFIKSEEMQKAFSETPVYSDIFMELATDEEAGARFVNGIIPKDLAKEIEKDRKKEKKAKKAEEDA